MKQHRLSLTRALLSMVIAAGPLAPLAWSEAPAGNGLRLEPETACHFLADERLQPRGGYRPTGTGGYRCASPSRPLSAGFPVTHEIRYLAQGDRDAVTTLILLLDVNSREDIQRAHRVLLERTERLVDLALDSEVPEAAAQAIMAGGRGSWPVAAAELTLARSPSRAGAYELRVEIR
jgi:hypothetical protein